MADQNRGLGIAFRGTLCAIHGILHIPLRDEIIAPMIHSTILGNELKLRLKKEEKKT
ncbi:MAG: hypothetical protein GY820_03190 [Gammaproteobacteria bacterium]|nr:hypothetical protein [Gammaproteobacteria bacterium]